VGVSICHAWCSSRDLYAQALCWWCTLWCFSLGPVRQREIMWTLCSTRGRPPRSRGLTKFNPCSDSRLVARGIHPPSCTTSGAIHRVWAAATATPWLSSLRPRNRCRNSLGHPRPCSKAQLPRRLLMGTCTGCKGTPWKCERASGRLCQRGSWGIPSLPTEGRRLMPRAKHRRNSSNGQYHTFTFGTEPNFERHWKRRAVGARSPPF